MTHWYMPHRVLFARGSETPAVSCSLPARGAQDLGCGDADYMSRMLSSAGLPLLRSYTGVDLSRPALEVARGNLARRALLAAREGALPAGALSGSALRLSADCEETGALRRGRGLRMQQGMKGVPRQAKSGAHPVGIPA